MYSPLRLLEGSGMSEVTNKNDNKVATSEATPQTITVALVSFAPVPVPE